MDYVVVSDYLTDPTFYNKFVKKNLEIFIQEQCVDQTKEKLNNICDKINLK